MATVKKEPVKGCLCRPFPFSGVGRLLPAQILQSDCYDGIKGAYLLQMTSKIMVQTSSSFKIEETEVLENLFASAYINYEYIYIYTHYINIYIMQK